MTGFPFTGEDLGSEKLTNILKVTCCIRLQLTLASTLS